MDADRLMRHLQGLADSGNMVIVVEHDMRIVAQVDWIVDLGRSDAGEEGGNIVASGDPQDVAGEKSSVTVRYLKAAIC
ncbi:DNA helicase UvrA [Rhizobium oryzihabitans]|jgi:excinuclease ABC subunit A|uniref:DNA helicase UvrA n=1 Tax=Rhizobium oryzihabitans TaxID=2267833 RepID=UPI004036F9B5